MMKLLPIALLIISNILMNIAWYGHLKFKQHSLWIVVLLCWGIAFFEYCFQVPANRLGHTYFSAPQLKILQEAISFTTFLIFCYVFLKEQPTYYDYAGCLLVCAGVFVSIYGAMR
jgi:uncharacterized protein